LANIIFGEKVLVHIANTILIIWCDYVRYYMIPKVSQTKWFFKVLHQWSKEELKAYDNVTIKEQDERGEREIVVQKALEKGEEKGREEMIIEMHKEGFSTRQIAKVSKKSEQEVTQIIDNHTNK